MTRTTTLTIAALIVTTLAAGAAAPAIAQDFRNDGREMHFRDHKGGDRFVIRRERGGLRGGLLAFVCSPRGADRLEHLLLTVEQRTDVTADQSGLFDAFRTAALTAQTTFADACSAAMPAGTERGNIDLAQRLRIRQDIAKAHVAAMDAVLPAFEAFYNSLTEAQKLALEPRRGRHHHRDFGMLPEPGAPVAPDALVEPQDPELDG
jgi:hypothetical protein